MRRNVIRVLLCLAIFTAVSLTVILLVVNAQNNRVDIGTSDDVRPWAALDLDGVNLEIVVTQSQFDELISQKPESISRIEPGSDAPPGSKFECRALRIDANLAQSIIGRTRTLELLHEYGDVSWLNWYVSDCGLIAPPSALPPSHSEIA